MATLEMITLPADTASVPEARDLVRQRLRDRVHDDVLADLALATSELVANAVMHATDGSLELAIEHERARVSVRVTSHGNVEDLAAVPDWELADPDEITGRGLAIVKAVVDAIEIDRRDDSVTVTVTKQLDGASRTDDVHG